MKLKILMRHGRLRAKARPYRAEGIFFPSFIYSAFDSIDAQVFAGEQRYSAARNNENV